MGVANSILVEYVTALRRAIPTCRPVSLKQPAPHGLVCSCRPLSL